MNYDFDPAKYARCELHFLAGFVSGLLVGLILLAVVVSL